MLRNLTGHLVKGRYCARFAFETHDIERAQALRHRCFRGAGGPGKGLDRDRFDDVCAHVLIEEVGTTTAAAGRLVGCFRLMFLASGAAIGDSYSAQYYDLSRLGALKSPLAEMGRFCIDPAYSDPDILRIAWGALTAFVDARHVAVLFGCTSFAGTEATRYTDGFGLLRARYLAPDNLRAGLKAARVIRFDDVVPPDADVDLRKGLKGLPPLLRSYVALGGRVSDHAVIDDDLNSLHVFTTLEINAVPPARARLLRRNSLC